jgi:hypothetical protein
MFTTFQASRDAVRGKLNILQGTDEKNGMGLGVIAAGTTVFVPFNFSLMSILSMTETYVPLYALSGTSLRLEIQWVSSIQQFVNCNAALSAPAYGTFSDIEYIANIVELSDAGMAIVAASSGPDVEWVCQTSASYPFNAVLGTAQTQISMNMPAKYNSLKALYFTFRGTNASGALNRF